MSTDQMAERATSHRTDTVKKIREPMARRVTRRNLFGEVLRAGASKAVEVASNSTVQKVVAAGVILKGAQAAYDNYVAEENQVEKIAKYPPNKVWLGTAEFTINNSMRLRTDPSDKGIGNLVSSVTKIGGLEVQDGDVITITNPLVHFIETSSGFQYYWIQLPNTEWKAPLRNFGLLYAPQNVGNKTVGTLYDIDSQATAAAKDGKYHIQGSKHEPIPLDQTQVFSIQKKA